MKRIRRYIVGLSSVALVAASSGCSPRFWRNQADRDAYLAITRTIDDPRIQVPRFDVTPDPSSRFFDPHPLDCEPLPPDDPNAHQYMHAVDSWKGYSGWHKQGQSLVIENPQWYANLGLDPEDYDPTTGRYAGDGALPKLTLEDAINLAMIHGRSYQQQIEDVFTAALTVTAREFAFTARYFSSGSTEPEYNLGATLRPGQTRIDQVDQTANFGLRRILPSGATLAVGLANTTMWMFSGGGGTESVPRFTYSLTQPLLAAGGRKVVLEDLTQDQRTLLYEVRDLARFRRQYFTNVVATQSGGYLGLLRQVQTIRNQIDNISRIERQLDVLRAQASQKPSRPRAELAQLPPELGTPEALNVPQLLQADLEYDGTANELIWSRNDITDAEIAALLELSNDNAWRVAVEEIARQLTDSVVNLDVLQLESNLASSINQLRSQQRQLQDSLDNYKIFLGLPTDFPLGVDDRLLEPFRFIDANITQLDRDIEAYVAQWAVLDEDDPDLEESRAYLEGLRGLLRRVKEEGVELVRQDLARINSMQLDRLNQESQQRLKVDGLRDRRLFDGVIDRLDARESEFQRAEERLLISEQLSAAAEATADPLAARTLANQAAAVRREVRTAFNESRFKLLQDAQSLAAIQIGVRADLITIEPIDLSIEDATRIGLENRLDLMNERARVTDAWREVEIRKQELRSGLDVTVDGVISGPPNQRPFDFSNQSSTYRFGLEFDTPLDQIDERNAYRRAQIAYQQARRSYIAAEDGVKQDIRSAWRQLQVLEKNLETGKRAVRIAALQYDVAVEQANAPTSGGQGAGLRGRNLLDALGRVLDSQNALIGIFVDYETNRLTLARDMGTMTIGEDGVWEDPLYRRVTSGGNFLPEVDDDGSESGQNSDSAELFPQSGVPDNGSGLLIPQLAPQPATDGGLPVPPPALTPPPN